MIPLLGPFDPFPPTDRALDEPNGLLAAGGGLSSARLLDAYSRGIFPWFSDGDPVLWWSPDPRMVLETGDMHVSRSLRRRLRKRDYRVTMDRAFRDVLLHCASPREDQAGTWLLPPMIRAYQRLHDSGYAHSVEVWIGDEIAGGLYGVAVGRMFYGESMFSRRTDASKIALAHLVAAVVALGLSNHRLSNAHVAPGIARGLRHAAAAVSEVDRAVGQRAGDDGRMDTGRRS